MLKNFEYLRIAMNLVGVIVIIAGVLDFWQHISPSVLPASPHEIFGLKSALIAWEMFLGLWLIGGALPEAARRVAVGCFSVFACYTLYDAFAGRADCGCFGQVHVNPWFTATLVVAIALALVFLDNPAEDVLRKQQNLHFYVTKSSSAHIYIMETVFRRTIIGNWSRKGGVRSRRELRNFGFRAFRNL